MTDYPLRMLEKRYREETLSMVIVGVMAFDTIDFEAEDGLSAGEIVGERIEIAVEESGVTGVLSLALFILRVIRLARRLFGRPEVKRL